MKTTQKTQTNKPTILVCICGAACANTSKHAGRFRRRHPAKATHDHALGALLRKDIFKARQRLSALSEGSMAESLRFEIKDYQRQLSNLVEVES